MTRRWCLLLSACILGGAGVAQAGVVHYTEPHPVAPGVHKGMCYIEGAHVHAYKPHKPVLYVRIGGHYSFVGDPVEFEAEAPRPKYAYHSHHPVFWISPEGEEAEHYCYISGPHHHWYRPPPRWKFKRKGGVYWYVGARPRWYRKRWRRRRHINRHYAEVHIVRPVVTVEPPVGFVGVVIGPRGRSRVYGDAEGGVYVAGPRARVRVRGPGVHVRVPGVGVVLGGGHRHGRVRVRGGGHRVRVRGGHGRVRVRHRGHRGRGHRGRGRRRRK